jgi:23S rRNA (pseudouridine1915-N3)-methyltransferase
MRILVIAVGRLRPPFQDDSQHYHKLLAGLGRVEVMEVREGEQVAARIPGRAYVILMASDGRTMDSLRFSQWLEERRQAGRELCFVLGGPRGIDLDRCDLRLSLGPMTLPHQLARIVLLEQLFRAHKIIAGQPYHY